MKIAHLSALPYPHHLFRCEWSDFHERLVEIEGSDAAGRRRAFERFIATIGPSRVASCPRHEGDWFMATRIACELASSGVIDLVEAAEYLLAAGVDEQTVEAVNSFSEEPIWIEGSRFGNGQHRSCAMRTAGAVACPIED